MITPGAKNGEDSFLQGPAGMMLSIKFLKGICLLMYNSQLLMILLRIISKALYIIISSLEVLSFSPQSVLRYSAMFKVFILLCFQIVYMFQNIETKNPLEIKHNVNSIQNNDCKNFNIEKLFITLNLSPIALNLSPIALILSPIALILS